MDTVEHSLQIGALIDDRYRIDGILGEGGFGVTYKAYDQQLDYTVVIKEYLPQECASRAGDSITVQARTNRADDYQYGLERFLDEARNLARFQHPNIVRVSNFIKANGTAYFVMDYAEGEELGEWLKANPGSLSEEAILNIVTPILEGLAEVHQTGLLHRDIKPSNIFLRKQAGPLLIDFGAARQALGEHSKSISAIISQGYAPPEQYTSRGKQGPYTDLYALGATLYYLITGQQPVESVDRSHDIHEGEPDPMTPAIELGKGKVSDWLLQLTDQLLNISPKQRPQSAEMVLEAIKNKTTASIDTPAATSPAQAGGGQSRTRVVKDTERFSKPANQGTPSKSGSKSGLYGGLAAAVLIAIGTGIYVSQQPNDAVSENDKAQSVATQESNKTLAKGKAILFVESTPSGAEVYLDKHLLGKTPYQADNLPKGIFELTLKHDMSSDLTESLQLTDNLVVKKNLTLKAATGNYSVFSTPAGASIVIDGNDTGQQTPASLTGITAGEHTLTLSKDAYYPKQLSIYIRKEETLRGDFILEGGDLIMYEGKWIKPEEKDRLIAAAKARLTDAERIKMAEEEREKQKAKARDLKNLEALQKHAEQGNKHSQYQLGKRYEYDWYHLLKPDAAKAVHWYRLAAKQQHPDAEIRLGYMYEQGKGIEKNKAEAKKLYLKAVEHGGLDMTFELERMNVSVLSSLELKRMQAQAGYGASQYELGNIYTNGKGVEKNEAEGIRWYRMAARQEHFGAKKELRDRGLSW